MASTLHPFLPPLSQWFDRPEDATVWLSVFRVFRVPYDTLELSGQLAEFGQIRAVFVNANLPYPIMDFGLDPMPDGSVRPKGKLVGWNATERGVLLLLMTPLKSDRHNVDPETAARFRIDSARAVLVGFMGLNAAFERICEFSINYEDESRAAISRTSHAMENPLFYEAPCIYDSGLYEQIRSVLEGIDSLDDSTQDRVRLALRWYQRALGEDRILRMDVGGVDTLINYWVALETLVRVGEQKVAGTLIKELAAIHGITTQEAGQTFPISKIYQYRRKVIHQGQLSFGASFELQAFLSDVFMDVLVLRVMKLSKTTETRKYLDGRAYGYL